MSTISAYCMKFLLLTGTKKNRGFLSTKMHGRKITLLWESIGFPLLWVLSKSMWMQHVDPMGFTLLQFDEMVRAMLLIFWTQSSFYTLPLYGESLAIQLACCMGQQLDIKNLIIESDCAMWPVSDWVYFWSSYPGGKAAYQRIRIDKPYGLPLKRQPNEPLRVNILFQHMQNMLSNDTAVIAETGDSWFNCQKLILPAECGHGRSQDLSLG